MRNLIDPIITGMLESFLLARLLVVTAVRMITAPFALVLSAFVHHQPMK